MPAIFAYFAFLLELKYLQNKEAKDDGSLFIFLPLFTILLLTFVAHFTTFNGRTVLLRNLSTGIYLLHYPILNFCRIVMDIYHIKTGSEYIFLIVIILAHIICLFAYIKGGKISKLLK